MLLQAVVNVLSMQASLDQLIECAAAVLLIVGGGSAEGCILLLQAIAAAYCH